MEILGLNKTTLLDYPEHVAATVFTAGCNFRCPFCHNKDLVLLSNTQAYISEDEIFGFLQKRKGILQGVCITGGEPTLQPDLPDFIYKIKQMGYLVKLDTNGYLPEVIIRLTREGLLDYIAMDVKAPLPKYEKVTGCSQLDIERIRQSITAIQNSGVAYEFRTTVIKELHEEEDFCEIAKLLAGSRAYFLQSYREDENVIQPGFHAYSVQKMRDFAELVRSMVPNTRIRGIEDREEIM